MAEHDFRPDHPGCAACDEASARGIAAPVPTDAPGPGLCTATQQTETWGEMWCGLFAGHEPTSHHWFSDRTNKRPASPAPSRPEGLDDRLIRDTLDHIEGLNLVMAALRVGGRTPEKGLRLLDRTNDVPSRLARLADTTTEASDG